MEVKHLINELEQKHNAEVVLEKHNSFPVFTTTIHYHPIQKTPMDILMKMMLIAFQKAPIKAPDVLASILLVEPLFIEDLCGKMLQAHLIVVNEDGAYQLTEKGSAQLQAGIFEEELEKVTEEIMYSPIHESAIVGDFDTIFELDDIPEPLSYVMEHVEEIHEQNVIHMLQQSYVNNLHEEEEAISLQLFIQSIESYEIGTIQDIPITIFICKEHSTNRLFARVFNHLTNEFDSKLEQFVTENEKHTWSELK